MRETHRPAELNARADVIGFEVLEFKRKEIVASRPHLGRVRDERLLDDVVRAFAHVTDLHVEIERRGRDLEIIAAARIKDTRLDAVGAVFERQVSCVKIAVLAVRHVVWDPADAGIEDLRPAVAAPSRRDFRHVRVGEARDETRRNPKRPVQADEEARHLVADARAVLEHPARGLDHLCRHRTERVIDVRRDPIGKRELHLCKVVLARSELCREPADVVVHVNHLLRSGIGSEFCGSDDRERDPLLDRRLVIVRMDSCPQREW